jgi:hypothetical protein
MSNAKSLPDKKVLGFPTSRESVETKLLGWIRGVLQSNEVAGVRVSMSRLSERVCCAPSVNFIVSSTFAMFL